MRAIGSVTTPTAAPLTVAAITTAHRADPSDSWVRHLKASELLVQLDEVQTKIRGSEHYRDGDVAEVADITGVDLTPTENAMLREIYRRQELLRLGMGWTTVTNQAPRIAEGAFVVAVDGLDDARLEVGGSLPPNDAA